MPSPTDAELAKLRTNLREIANWLTTNHKTWMASRCEAAATALEQRDSVSPCAWMVNNGDCLEIYIMEGDAIRGRDEMVARFDGVTATITPLFASPPSPSPGTAGEIEDLRAQLAGCDAENIAIRSRLTAAEQERDELAQWKAVEKQFLSKHAIVLLNAGYKGDSGLEGTEWLVAERDAARKEAEEARAKLDELPHSVKAIIAERKRQIAAEGWTAEHDDNHYLGEMAMAAACYAAPQRIYVPSANAGGRVYADAWPWDECWDKRGRHDRERQLAIAGALILAELDRINRGWNREYAGDGTGTANFNDSPPRKVPESIAAAPAASGVERPERRALADLAGKAGGT